MFSSGTNLICAQYSYGGVKAVLVITIGTAATGKKAVQQLATKELLSFAGAVRSRICLGKPNKQKDAPGFAQTVDKHIQKFQPYFQLTGVMCCFLVACLQALPLMQVIVALEVLLVHRTNPLELTNLLYTSRCDS